MNFGQNLKKLRKSKNMSQEELAEKVMVTRQSVSKWETGEAYPEMNNILELCKIFHCHINDLVNDNILDIDSLDEDVKMSAVKFKKEKQKQMKGISNILSIIGKIGGIVARVGLVFIIIAVVAIPFLFKSIDIKDGKIVSNSNRIKMVEYDKSYDLRLNDSTILTNGGKGDLKRLANSIEKFSKPIVVLFLELGLVFVIAFIIVLIKALKHLELLFSNINKGDTPFTLDNVNHIKKMSYLMIACVILSSIGQSLLEIPFKSLVQLDFNLVNIVEILFLYSMSLVFEYGHEIQLDSKGKIYGEED